MVEISLIRNGLVSYEMEAMEIMDELTDKNKKIQFLNELYETKLGKKDDVKKIKKSQAGSVGHRLFDALLSYLECGGPLRNFHFLRSL